MPGPPIARLCINFLSVEATPLTLHIDAIGPVELSREEALQLRDFLNAQYPVAPLSVTHNDRECAVSAEPETVVPSKR